MKQNVIVNNIPYDGVANVVLVDADDGDNIIFNQTSGATADPEDVVAGETYYADGEKHTGTHECNDDGDINVDPSTLRIPWENIDNKPFYEGVVFDTITWDGDITDRETVTVPINEMIVTYYKVCDEYISPDNIVNSIVTLNGVNTNITRDDIILSNENASYVANIYAVIVKDDNDVIRGNYNGFDVEVHCSKKGVYFAKFTFNYNLITTTQLSTSIQGVQKHLDSKFIKDDIMRTSEKGRAGGVATLDDDGKIPQDQLPDFDIDTGSKFAKDIIFTEDLITTSKVGNIELVNGKATIPAKNKSIVDVWNYVFCKDKNPTVKQPSVSLHTINNMAYEVGTRVIPKFNAAFNSGSYEFDDSTNVVVESWEIKNNTNNQVLNVAVGEFDSIVVDANTNFIITATAHHSEGSVPSTALNNKYTAGKIQSGTKSKSSSAITGYRNSFYGAVTNKNNITSDLIRELTSHNKRLNIGDTFDIQIPVGTVRVIIAYPTTLPRINSIKDNNAMNSEISSAFTLYNIDVNDVSGTNPLAYNVYVLDYGIVNDKENIYTVVI